MQILLVMVGSLCVGFVLGSRHEQVKMVARFEQWCASMAQDSVPDEDE